MTLPASYRWADDHDGGAHLYQNYGCVAVIRPDGTTRFKYWQKEFHSKAASVAQAKRFIERWINARSTARAMECALWRYRYFKPESPPRNTKRAAEAAVYAKRTATSTVGGSSSRVIKVAVLPDEFDAIYDVGQPLHAFGLLSVLKVTPTSSDALSAQRGTNTVAQPRNAPAEHRRRARSRGCCSE